MDRCSLVLLRHEGPRSVLLPASSQGACQRPADRRSISQALGIEEVFALRGRAADRADRRVQSASARLSALVMTLLPAAMLLVLLLTSRSVRLVAVQRTLQAF